MQLSLQEIQKLEPNPPFSIIVWKIGEGRIPQCILRVPDKGELPTFTMIFDNFVLDEKTSKVVTLPFSIASSQRQFSKFGASLFYLEEPEDRGILKCFAQVTEIEVVTCRVVTQGGRKKSPIQKSIIPVSIRRQGWQSRNRQEIQEILRKRHLSDTNTQSMKPQQQQEKSVEQVRAIHELNKQSLLQLPLIERCIYQQQLLAQNLSKQKGDVTRRLFWCKLLPFALEKSRKFILQANASQMIAQKRSVYSSFSRPVNPPSFPATHLWFEFQSPIETSVCRDTAAIFVFSASDTSLIEELARQEKGLPQNLRDIYLPEKNRLSLSVVNIRGEIVWAMSLPSTEQYADKNDQEWLVPAWYTCPPRSNPIGISKLSSNNKIDPLCKSCKEAQVYFSTWLLVVWQALQGLYRERNVDETIFDRIGVEHIKQSFRQKGTIQVTHRYRVLRYTDISAVLNRPLPSELPNPRGSWVEALEPDQVGYEKREMPLITRTLRDPRYADGNRERGTNQIEVRPHTRHIPVRTDQEKITKITAKHYPKKKGRN